MKTRSGVASRNTDPQVIRAHGPASDPVADLVAEHLAASTGLAMPDETLAALGYDACGWYITSVVRCLRLRGHYGDHRPTLGRKGG